MRTHDATNIMHPWLKKQGRIHEPASVAGVGQGQWGVPYTQSGYDKVSKHASIACRQRTNFVGRRGWKKGRTITKEMQIKERTKEIEDKLLTGCAYKIFST